MVGFVLSFDRNGRFLYNFSTEMVGFVPSFDRHGRFFINF